MKRFQFTLEAVRIVRQRHEQEAMELYARALLARRQAMDRLDAVQRDLNAACQELRSLFASGGAASKAAQAHDYQRTVEKRRDDSAIELSLAERRLNAALQGMLNARRQREIVDKAYERQKSHHQRGQSRREQKLLDDLAGRRANFILSWNPTEALT